MYPDVRSRSAELFLRAQAVMPGGNSRHSLTYEPYPLYAVSGRGCYVRDADGAEYVDCINNMSANIHGHRHPAIIDAVNAQLSRLVSAGMPTEVEIELAELMTRRVRSVERIRFTNSGSEALMFAVRAARAFTGRTKIAKIEGGYHGSYDALDVSNRPPPELWGDPDAPDTVCETEGLTPGSVADTIVLPVNRVAATRAIIDAHRDQLAAVVIDPLVSKMGFLALHADFLRMIREETSRSGVVLIFDEVFSFRLGPQGAQGLTGITPDLSTFGKIIGGGLPIGAVGGRSDIMEVFDHLAPKGPRVEHSGTFNANPVSMAAGIAALELLDARAFEHLERLGDRLRDGLQAIAADLDFPAQVQGRGSLAAMLPHRVPLTDFRSFSMALSDSPTRERWPEFHRGMLNAGVLPIFPSGFVLSTPMDEQVIDRILGAAARSLQSLNEARVAAA